MDLKQLESFIEVVKCKSFSKAAGKLYLSQPTITNHVQALEEEIGFMLLIRSNRQILLTQEGRLFYDYAINTLNGMDHLQLKLGKNKSIRGQLEIHSSSIPAQYILPRLVRDFSKVYEQVNFRIHPCNSSQVINEIRKGSINYGIVGHRHEVEGLEYLEIFKDELVLITHPHHYPKERKSIELGMLRDEKFILREDGSGTRYLAEKRIGHVALAEPVALVQDNESIKQMVALGIGVSLMSKLAIEKELRLNAISAYQIEGLEMERKFYYVYHNSRYLSPLDKAFKDFVVSSLIQSE